MMDQGMSRMSSLMAPEVDRKARIKKLKKQYDAETDKQENKTLLTVWRTRLQTMGYTDGIVSTFQGKWYYKETPLSNSWTIFPNQVV